MGGPPGGGGVKLRRAGGWFLVFLYREDLLPFDRSRELCQRQVVWELTLTVLIEF